jgi:hypothetical protein
LFQGFALKMAQGRSSFLGLGEGLPSLGGVPGPFQGNTKIAPQVRIR